ncbi:MAG: DUF1565 domain-containing protein, partial [Chlamydiota bacterium]
LTCIFLFIGITMNNMISAESIGVEYVVDTNGSDSNSGTFSAPWQTIQKAANEAVAGSTVFVRGGIYREKIAINVEGNASEGHITFTNYNGEHVTISGEGVPNNPSSYTDDIIYIENKSYLRIAGFEIKDLNTVEGSGIRFWGAGSHIELINNTIHNIRGGGEDGGAMGITIYGSNDNRAISHILIDGNKIYDCDPAHSEALTLNGNVKFFKVVNNIVHDVNNIGIDFIGGETWLSTKFARNGICRGNTVYRAHSNYGDGFAAGIYVDGGKSIIIEKNEVYACDLGIEVGAENKEVETKNIKVRNNFIHDNDKAGLVFGGYDASRGIVKGCKFTQNILVDNDSLSKGFGEIWVQYAQDNKVFRNYIDPNEQNLIISSYEGNMNNFFDYDNICTDYGIENSRFIWNGTEYVGLTNFQKQTGQEKNARICRPEIIPEPDEAE